MWAQERSPRWWFGAAEAGPYVGAIWLVLLGAYALAWVDGVWFRVGAVAIAAFFAVDTLVVNTAIAFVSRQPVNAWRSAFFTVLAFGQIATAFGVFYAALRDRFRETVCWLDPLYFSFVTIATLGYGDISPGPRLDLLGALLKATVIVELLTGVYFLAVILTTVVGWANASRPWKIERPKPWPPPPTSTSNMGSGP